MEKIKSFKEFISEKKSSDNNSTGQAVQETAMKMAFNCVYESESGEVTLSINEGFVKDLQLHIRETIDFLMKDHGIKGRKIDKELEKNLATVTSSFQKGDSPEETAKKITS